MLVFVVRCVLVFGVVVVRCVLLLVVRYLVGNVAGAVSLFDACLMFGCCLLVAMNCLFLVVCRCLLSLELFVVCWLLLVVCCWLVCVGVRWHVFFVVCCVCSWLLGGTGCFLGVSNGDGVYYLMLAVVVRCVLFFVGD